MNVELAQKGLEVAKEHPERFDMDHWYAGDFATVDGPSAPPCGTTACYAGVLSLLVAPVGTVIRWGGSMEIPVEHTARHVEPFAREALGITEDQSSVLFYLDNIEQVEAAVSFLADNPSGDLEAFAEASGFFPAEDAWDDGDEDDEL